MDERTLDHVASKALEGMPPRAARTVTAHFTKEGYGHITSIEPLVWLLKEKGLFLMGKPDIQAYWLEGLYGNSHLQVSSTLIARMIGDKTVRYIGTVRLPNGEVQRYSLSESGEMLAAQVALGREIETELKPKIEMNRPAPWARPVAPATAPKRDDGQALVAHELKQIRLVLEEMLISSQKLAAALGKMAPKERVVKEKPVTVPVEKKKRGRPRKSA
jgi:hypothetical protein